MAFHIQINVVLVIICINYIIPLIFYTGTGAISIYELVHECILGTVRPCRPFI